jgi:DNA (cytosine-5)-methyltransferase 1
VTRPLLLDLFCGAGGAAMGYHRAGFDVVGVDINPQPQYPFRFLQRDALEVLAGKPAQYMKLVHASPPCQAYSNLNAYNHADYPDLIGTVRDLLRMQGFPYVIENVPQAPLIQPVVLCGKSFGLKLYRHRGFEVGGFRIEPAVEYPHRELCARNGYLPTPERPFMSIHGGKHSRAWLEAAKAVMDVPWMTTIREVCEAIPPAYTEYIGKQLLAALEATS